VGIIVSKLGHGFCWTQEQCGLVLRCSSLSKISSHFVTTRGRSVGGATADRAWATIAKSIGLRSQRLIRVRQEHGRNIVVIRRSRSHSIMPYGTIGADAIVTDDPMIALGVRVADCVPILLCDPSTRTVGIVHAGWRGTSAGIAREVVCSMRDEFCVKPHEIIAVIGPSIGPCCYEVGEEVYKIFISAGYTKATLEKWFSWGKGTRCRLDLWRANRDQLVSLGVSDDRIHIAGLCTSERIDLFYSHRREGNADERFAAVIRVRSKNDGA